MYRLTLLATIAILTAGCMAAVPIDENATDGLTGPTAALLCHAGDGGAEVCNFEATVDPEGREANELSIAVNPTDPLNIIATGKDYTPEHAGDCVWDGVYVTKDGGETWMNSNLPASPGQRAQGNVDPTSPFTKFWCATDPVVRFGPDGTAYWTVMPYQCDPVTGSKAGRGVLPMGGMNDWAWSCSSMYVLVSEDGGETWPTVREVAFGERLLHDKQWIAAAPDGKRVLLCWDVGGERTIATSNLPPNPFANDRPGAACSVSTDKGDTWSDYQYVGAPVYYPWVDYGPDNTAWMAGVLWTGNDVLDVVVLTSDDGLTWSDPVKVGEAKIPPPGGEYGWPVLEGSDFRVIPMPAIAVDRSDGAHSGRAYVTWFTHEAGNGDIVLSWSDDGETWSDPAQVHDDGASPHDQFFPAVSVGPDGVVDVSWNDRRDDPANHVFHLYYAYSQDGGATFSENVRVTDVPSDEQYSHHQNGMIFLGDYRDSGSSEGAAHLVWVDTRNEKADVFVATVHRPSQTVLE